MDVYDIGMIVGSGFILLILFLILIEPGKKEGH